MISRARTTTTRDNRARHLSQVLKMDPLQAADYVIRECEEHSDIKSVLDDLQLEGSIEKAQELAIVLSSRQGLRASTADLLKDAPIQRFHAAIELPHPDVGRWIGAVLRRVIDLRPDVAPILAAHPEFVPSSVHSFLRLRWNTFANILEREMQMLLQLPIHLGVMAKAMVEADAGEADATIAPAHLIPIALSFRNEALDACLRAEIRRWLLSGPDPQQPIEALRTRLDVLEARHQLNLAASGTRAQPTMCAP